MTPHASRLTPPARITLKRSCWVLLGPTSGLTFRFSGGQPTLSRGLFGTLFSSPECAVETASRLLAGIPHELARLES